MSVDLNYTRKDFPMCDGKHTMNSHPLVYLDNAATSFKPWPVIQAVTKYYTEETTNVERGDSALSAMVTEQYENTRKSIARLIHCDPGEVVYTPGSTGALNLLAYGYGARVLKPGDVILTTKAEHASDILPWFRVAQQTGASIRYIPFDEDYRITAYNVRKVMDEHVRIVAFAGVGNVLGYIAPIQEICSIAHEYGAIAAVDGAQTVPHMKVDVQAMGIDFLSFSSHKMCGPSGVGVLYGRKDLLEQTDAVLLGGGSNARFDSEGDLTLKDVPEKFEAGTQPIEGVLGMGAAAEYLMSVGLDRIAEYEHDLRVYLVDQMKKLDNVILYNPKAETGIVSFNVKGVFPQDTGSYLSSLGIAVRSGHQCAKMLPEVLHVPGTVRASLYFYNTKEDCDALVEGLRTCTVDNAVKVFF